MDRDLDDDERENIIESEELTREKQQIKAMGLIGTKLAQFDVSMQKQDEIFIVSQTIPMQLLKL